MDILKDATPERYLEALRICLEAPELSGIVVILTHQTATEPARVAQALAPEIHKYAKPVLAVWMGGEDVAEGVRILKDGDVPVYDTPEQAVDTFMAMYYYTRNLELLQETPAQLPQELEVNHGQAQAYIQECLKRQSLRALGDRGQGHPGGVRHPGDAHHRGVLVPGGGADGPASGLPGGDEDPFPPDLSYKSEVGGVRIDLKNEAEVRAGLRGDHGRGPHPGHRRPRFWG